jgi:hypothetical protein
MSWVAGGRVPELNDLSDLRLTWSLIAGQGSERA